MKPAYRNAALAASGIIVAAIAANAVRNRPRSHRKVAQTLTVLIDRDAVAEALTDDFFFQRAVECDAVDVRRDEAMHLYEWTCPPHGDQHTARLALINAPPERGTELHLVMNDRKYNVKEVVRRLKYLLETGEIPTGARSA